MSRVRHLSAILLVGLCLPGIAVAAAPAIRCVLPPARDTLPPGTQRGLIQHLEQYPTISLATPRERAVARALLRRVRAMTAQWSDPRRARAAGYDPRTLPRTPWTPLVPTSTPSSSTSARHSARSIRDDRKP